MEAHIVYPPGTEIDSAQYVFLGGKDESTGGKGTEGECGYLESWISVCRGEERNAVDDGLHEVGPKDMVKKLQPHIHKQYYRSFPCVHLTPSSSQDLESRIHDYDINSPLRLPEATLRCIDEPANSSIPLCVTGRIRCRTQVCRCPSVHERLLTVY